MHPTVALLATLASTPNLPGAACVDHRDVFDACLDRGAHRVCGQAIRVCAGCPMLAACRVWVMGLPKRKRPFGVTAGMIRQARC